MMVTLCAGRTLGSSLPIRRGRLVVGRVAALFFGMTMLLRSGPIRILSLALSKSCISTTRAFAARGHQRGPLIRLARSAPLMPGVPRAMMAGLTSWPIGILRMCTFGICSRPRMSGSVA